MDNVTMMQPVEDCQIQLIRRCVDCQGENIVHAAGKFSCPDCGREYLFDESGVLHAFPEKQSNSSPAFYKTNFFRHWLDCWNDIITDWIIYKNRYYRWFSMSGHLQVWKFIGQDFPESTPIIDLGCGPGQFFYLVPPHRQCIGLDSNLHSLQLMKKKFPHVLAIHGDLQNTPFRTESLEYVVSIHTLEHLYFIAESLEEIRRITMRDGKLLFTLPTEGGAGWELGRKLITGPHLRRKYQLDIKRVMDIEHINDANRVLKFIKFYFHMEKITYFPFSFLPFLSINASISGVAKSRQEL